MRHPRNALSKGFQQAILSCYVEPDIGQSVDAIADVFEQNAKDAEACY
jgi:hypothetical protein